MAAGGAGTVVALLGANGAGKTTLLRALTGLLSFHDGRITAGEVLFEGVPVGRASATALVRRGMAQVMEGRRIFAELTVEENLRAGAVTVRDRRSVAATTREVLEGFPLLAERRGNQAGYLSGGEQQMLAIGRALMSSPRLLLLDEPSLGLAPLIVAQIAERIGALNAAGTTVLLVEQNAAMALASSPRVAGVPRVGGGLDHDRWLADWWDVRDPYRRGAAVLGRGGLPPGWPAG